MEIGVKLNQDEFLLSALNKACKYKNDIQCTRLPIKKSMLQVLIRQCQLHFGAQPYLASLYTSLISTAYFGLFRIGELTAGSHPVKVTDVHIARNKQKILFILRTSVIKVLDCKPLKSRVIH